MFVDISLNNSTIRINYESLDQLPEILKFEGSRLTSLISRGIGLSSFNERKWDEKRHISLNIESLVKLPK